MVFQDDSLADWGEFRLLNEIVLPAVRTIGPPKKVGDDCAFIPVSFTGKEELVVTTDVGPKPMTWAIGKESYWSWGWYSVAVNLSDLASAGASPIAFANSIDAPPEMKVKHLSEFFEGIKDACQKYGVQSAGGNLRAASKFACHGTAIGAVDSNLRIGRDGCAPGDIIVAVGESGQFMSAFLRVRAAGFENASEVDKTRLLGPHPRIAEMRTLARAAVISAATDNSDGVLGSLWNIAERSNCAFELNIQNEDIPKEVADTASVFHINVMNLMMCWGDWQIIATVRQNNFQRFKEIAVKNNITHTVLGNSIAGLPAIYQRVGDTKKRLRIIRNENFTSQSYNADLDKHLDYMLRSDLFESS